MPGHIIMSLSVVDSEMDSFESYSQLKDHVRDFERTNHVQLVHRDSQTLTARL